MKIVDTRGLLCPAPLVMTKRALDSASIGEEFEVISNNSTATTNLTNYLEELGVKPLIESRDNEDRLYFRKSESKSTASPESFCNTAPENREYVVAVKSDKMGLGDDTLGTILMRAFINSLDQSEKLPSHIVLYNSGVNIAIAGSDTSESLKKLEQAGVTIVVCGTCADYFDIKTKLAVGVISNMYSITKILSQTGHVIYP